MNHRVHCCAVIHKRIAISQFDFKMFNRMNFLHCV